MGIAAGRRRHIGQVGTEILVTGFAVVLRVRDVQFLGAPRHQITNIMQLTQVDVFSQDRVPATRTGAFWYSAAFLDNLGLGQVFDPSKSNIRFILAWTQLGVSLFL